jgi:membrane protease YdiL (CAAX protease family)
MNSETAKSKTKVYFRAILFVVFTVIAGFFLLIAFLGGLIGAFSTGDLWLAAGGIFYFVLFLVTMFIAKKFEPYWRKFEELRGLKRKTTRESIKENLPFLVTIILIWF